MTTSTGEQGGLHWKPIESSKARGVMMSEGHSEKYPELPGSLHSGWPSRSSSHKRGQV